MIYIWTLLLVSSTAWGQAPLDPPQKREQTAEQKVDEGFGVVVGYLAQFLLFDVVFWDNNPELKKLDQFTFDQKINAVYADPLGWGFFVQSGQTIKFIDFQGQVQAQYRSQFQSINRVQLSKDGRWIFVGDGSQKIEAFQRSIPQKEPLKLSFPDQGQWTAYTHLNLLPLNQVKPTEKQESQRYSVFGTSKGNSWILDHNKKFSKIHSTQVGSISAYTQRTDERYWAYAVSNTSSSKIVVVDQVQTTNPRTFTVEGPVIELGFDDSFLWAITQNGWWMWPVYHKNAPSLHTLKSVKGSWGFKALSNTRLIQTDQGYQWIKWTHQEGQNLKIQSYPLQDLPYIKAKGDQQNKTIESLIQSQAQLDSQTFKVLQGLLKHQSNHIDHPTRLTNLTSWTRSGDRILVENQKGMSSWKAKEIKLPFIVLWLVLGACFFTLRMRFVNFRLFGHAIRVVRGDFDEDEGHVEGEVSHFQALTSALSATVGLGNIAGVAIAVSVGGPGATFWMIMAGLLGMASKFTECTLGQKYRTVDEKGQVMGGAMHYLSKGLTELKLPMLGKVLAVMFAFLCVGGSFGGGNAFQVKQSLGAVESVIPALADAHWLYGLIMVVLVGIVILGGIQRIAQTAEKIVPLMCGLYVVAALYIILVNFTEVPAAVITILQGAFSPDALYGGFIGVLVVGFQRAAFSNEAGIGSAAIAHAAAKTEYPVREGVVALLEPFIDTVIVCTMTALVIVMTGAYQNPEYGTLISSGQGAALTSKAMGEEISFFPYILSIAVILFAYSTMISWSYYGERCWTWLFGEKAALVSLGSSASLIYRVLFLCFVFLGSIMTADNILTFSDLMILGMAFPNVLGLFLLSKGVRKDLDEYEELMQDR